MALAYGYMYIIFTRLSIIYETIYGFSQGLIGLTYLGIGKYDMITYGKDINRCPGIGTIVGPVFTGILSDR